MTPGDHSAGLHRKCICTYSCSTRFVHVEVVRNATAEDKTTVPNPPKNKTCLIFKMEIDVFDHHSWG